MELEKNEFKIEDNTPSYYHPGISGSVVSKDGNFVLGYFGALHPKIISNTYGFEIFLENLVEYKANNTRIKKSLTFSDYQKSDRDFAFFSTCHCWFIVTHKF